MHLAFGHVKSHSSKFLHSSNGVIARIPRRGECKRNEAAMSDPTAYYLYLFCEQSRGSRPFRGIIQPPAPPIDWCLSRVPHRCSFRKANTNQDPTCPIVADSLEPGSIKSQRLGGINPSRESSSIAINWVEDNQPRLINRSLGFKEPWSSISEIHQVTLETTAVCHHWNRGSQESLMHEPVLSPWRAGIMGGIEPKFPWR